MNPISAFFVRYIIIVYFFYGLAFFALGLILAQASRRRSEFRFVRAIRPLAFFGLCHALHEWVEMFQKIAALATGYTPGLAEEIARTGILVFSFLLLLAFGLYLFGSATASWHHIWPWLSILGGLWAVAVAVVVLVMRPSALEAVAMADVLARYSLGIPGAVLGAAALMRQQRTFREHDMPQFGRDLVWAATALALFGIVGQLFVRPTALMPSSYLNSTTFLQWFGVPVQLFRGLMAVILTYFLGRTLEVFELENRRRLDEAVQARVRAQAAQLESERRSRFEIEQLYRRVQDREALLARLLRQVVSAQEAERQRIARELHDATGQSLTALSLGLKGVQTLLERSEHPAAAAVRDLGAISTQALGELRQIIADLRPSHLDDLGLAPALEWYAQKYQERHGIQTRVIVGGDNLRLPADYEIVLFRITQEALTNIAKHAAATKATVSLVRTADSVELTITDNGRGFDPSALLPPGHGESMGGWGLVGMRERAALLGGRVEVVSQPGQGTEIRVRIPLPTTPPAEEEPSHDGHHSRGPG
ncbi:MAG: sensor histidine kinase [Anaerolineae bacterium]|nr:sensor histidine kinase [Caldilineales bacterium]MCX7853927.1 sensor histidine kinase [Caldilineales bacterium]MDW8267691.1 sensor histidine kinase [Anaerolineae bacterium]